MHVTPPIPGYWYANPGGRLMQVRVVLYRDGQPARVMLETVGGQRQCLDLSAWCRLDLSLHAPGADRRRRRGVE